MKDLEFHECEGCAKKPGTPILCSNCLHNREAIGKASNEIKRLNSIISSIVELVRLEE